jgi:hypothetical protein
MRCVRDAAATHWQPATHGPKPAAAAAHLGNGAAALAARSSAQGLSVSRLLRVALRHDRGS